ncbi:hypothetical protein [Mycobacterium antarcticum]|uniref:hypothetical protein n=1 Tax=unclassified Mycolicibacterium TaxID=2636767 RepID=UPI0024E0C7D1|nr:MULTISPECIES: hypothetical protein [unclassified Mycolicibacterium]
MDDEDDRETGRDHPAVIWAAAAAAVALVAILVVAVIRTSDSSHAPAFVPPAPYVDTTSAAPYTTSSSTRESYAVPSVQTSQDSGVPPITGAPDAGPAPGDESTPSAPATISNPYGTTTPTNAGHV